MLRYVYMYVVVVVCFMIVVNVYTNIGGHSLADLDPVWFRHHIGVVSQEPVLFACSISDNISFGRGDATHEEVVEAAKQANAHDFISSFDVSTYVTEFVKI